MGGKASGQRQRRSKYVKPRPWRGVAQVTEDVFEDAQFLKSGSKETRMERSPASRHTRTSKGTQTAGKQSLARSGGSTLPFESGRTKNGCKQLQRRITRVGVDGFHLKVPLDLSTETCGKIAVFLGNSEAMWLFASAGQHASLPSYTKECHE